MFSGILFVTLITFLVKNAMAITDEQKAYIEKEFVTFGAECLVPHPLTPDDILSFKEKKFPEGENAPCFTSCVLKKLKLFDDDGKFSYDKALETTKGVFSEDDHKNLTELLGKCDKVNEEENSGEGCERAKLTYNCLMEIAPEYGFDVNI